MGETKQKKQECLAKMQLYNNASKITQKKKRKREKKN